VGEGSINRVIVPLWSKAFQPPPGAGATTWSTGGVSRKIRAKLLDDDGDEK
jgi:hypothetical protein